MDPSHLGNTLRFCISVFVVKFSCTSSLAVKFQTDPISPQPVALSAKIWKFPKGTENLEE